MSIQHRFNIAESVDANFSTRKAQDMAKRGNAVSKEEYAVISSEVMRKRAECIRKGKRSTGRMSIYTANYVYLVRVYRDHFFIISGTEIENK